MSNGYTQYPDDSSSNLFKNIKSQCMASSQLIIHRDEDLMYYIYVRKFDKSKYLGFAVVVNGYFFVQHQPLFSLFEKEIEGLIESGIIINLTNSGEITSTLALLNNEEEEVMSVISSLRTRVNSIKAIKHLPPVDFSVSISSRKIFKYSDPFSEIANASSRFGYTIILKDEDYDSVRLNSFKNILKNLNATKDSLIQENIELKKTNQEIKRQKNQFKKVIILFIIVIACAIGLYFLYSNLNDTQYQLDTAKSTITEQRAAIEEQHLAISDLKKSVKNLRSTVQEETDARRKAEGSLETICSYSPCAITNCSVNSRQFTFDYFCPEEKEVTVVLKAINERNNDIVTSTHTITLYKGTGTETLAFDRTLSTSDYYYVVLMYDGHIVGGTRW